MQIPAFDPIPWHLDAGEARAHGLSRAGWYVMAYDGTPVVGPHDDPEACTRALKCLSPPSSALAARR